MAASDDWRPQADAAAELTFVETHSQISPDRKWLAYYSNQTGRYEVYVKPFPSGGFNSHTYAVSPDGQRFLISRPAANLQSETASAPITVILNWTPLLKR